MNANDGSKTKASMFRSLKVRNYRLYAIGSITSNTGTWMQRIAQDWVVLKLTGNDPIALGAVTFLQFSPTLLIGMVGGVIADRYDKRTILRFTQAAVAVFALVLGLLDIANIIAIWQVYVLALCLGVVNAIGAPARQAFASELVGPTELINAVALNSASFNAARLIGPALAGVLIGWIDTGPVFLLNAVTSVWIIVLLTMIDPTKLYRPERLPRQRGQVRDAVRYVRQRPNILLTIVLVSIVSLFGLNLQVIIPLVSTRVFHQGATQYGLLASALALGTLAGALTGAGRARQPRLRQLVIFSILFGLLEIGLSFITAYLPFAIMLIPLGVVTLLFTVSANSIVQLSADPAMRGRVMALYMTFFMGAGAFGSPLIGVLADWLGISGAIMVGGALTAIGAGVVGILMARMSGGVHVETHLHSRPHLEVHLGQEQILPHPRPVSAAVDGERASA